MLNFADYSKYKKFGHVVGFSVALITFVIIFLTIFFFRENLIQDLKKNWLILLPAFVSIYILIIFLLPSIRKKIKSPKIVLFNKGVKIGFLSVNETIAEIVNFFLLLFVYILGIGLVALVSKFKNKSYLDLKKYRKKKSYWQSNNMGTEDIEQYYRQF